MVPKATRKKADPPKAEPEIDFEIGDPPTDIDPYKVLEIPTDADQDAIKKAYRKAALKNHPDKVSDADKTSANKKFQDIAFAYAVLSDERRRKRYDNTGSTAETLDLDDDDFDWLSFFREQWTDVVTAERIAEDKALYETNGEQRTALLEAYTKFKGDMDKVYQVIMHSDVLQDDDRFRALIDGAIADGEVEGYKKYTEESEKSKQNRIKNAKRQIADFEKSEKQKAAKNGKNGKSAGSEADLAALIRGKQAGRTSKFLEHLEEKYAPSKTRKREEEPSEEAFAAMAARSKKSKASK